MIQTALPHLAEHLKQIRMTQTELAHRIGVTPVTMSHYMTGRTTPTLRTVKAICRETGLSLAELGGTT